LGTAGQHPQSGRCAISRYIARDYHDYGGDEQMFGEEQQIQRRARSN
jgi:hypothetical protein